MRRWSNRLGITYDSTWMPPVEGCKCLAHDLDIQGSGPGRGVLLLFQVASQCGRGLGGGGGGFPNTPSASLWVGTIPRMLQKGGAEPCAQSTFTAICTRRILLHLAPQRPFLGKGGLKGIVRHPQGTPYLEMHHRLDDSSARMSPLLNLLL